MEPKDVREHIRHTGRCFDAELHTKAYAELHADAAQLRRLIAPLAAQEKQVFLDLGTGNGYVAFSLIKEYPMSTVIGLDIAETAIEQDNEMAKQQGLTNVHFRVFDGVILPFTENYFSGVVCRYALHHFPCRDVTLEEIARTIKHNGTFILADAIRNGEDDIDFINTFQDLKGDGHVRMHKSKDLIQLVRRHGFELVDCFESCISFSRTRTKEYDELLKRTPPHIQESYHIVHAENEIYLTFKILNTIFRNRGNISRPMRATDRSIIC